MTTPTEYNLDRIRDGRIGGGALQVAALLAQDALGLKTDGLIGPMTESALSRIAGSPYLLKLLTELGEGEIGRDNGGPTIARYFRETYVPGRAYGEWCAAVTSYCLVESGVIDEDALTRAHRLVAKRLVARVAELGCWVVSPAHGAGVREGGRADLQPEDLIVWSRGLPTSWSGHVGTVLAYEPISDHLVTVDGNSEAYPACVRVRHWRAGTWRRRFHAASRLGHATSVASSPAAAAR